MEMFCELERRGDYYVGKYNLPISKPFEVGKYSDAACYFGHKQKHKQPVCFRAYSSESAARSFFNKLING